MKNKVKLIVLFVIVGLIQVINIVENAQYMWSFIVIELIVLLLISIAIAAIGVKKYRKLVKCFNDKNYDFVIQTSNIMFLNTSEEKHYFYYMKAISYLEKEDYDKFNSYIDKIEHKNLLPMRYYLKYIYYTIMDEEIERERYKKQYLDLDSKNITLTSYYDKVIYLLEKQETYTDEEKAFIDSMRFEQIKQLIYR